MPPMGRSCSNNASSNSNNRTITAAAAAEIVQGLSETPVSYEENIR